MHWITDWTRVSFSVNWSSLTIMISVGNWMFVPSLPLRFKILDILVLFLIYIIIFYLHIMFQCYWNKTFESLANNFHSAYIRFCIILLFNCVIIVMVILIVLLLWFWFSLFFKLVCRQNLKQSDPYLAKRYVDMLYICQVCLNTSLALTMRIHHPQPHQ